MGSDLDEFTRLSPKYGLAGVAAASVVASLIGYAYLICALVKSGRWPRPFAWPRNFRSISRFLRFAGPVLLAVFFEDVGAGKHDHSCLFLWNHSCCCASAFSNPIPPFLLWRLEIHSAGRHKHSFHRFLQHFVKDRSAGL